jgi:hypothetical protein
MIPVRPVAGVTVLMALLLGLAPGVASATRVEIEVSPLVDLHFYLRSLNDSSAAACGLEGVRPVARDYARLDSLLGNPLAWGTIDAGLSASIDAADAMERFEQLPESMAVAPNRKLAIRAEAERLMKGLASIEPAFLRRIWPAHHAAIDSARAEIETGLEPREADCFAFIEKSLLLLDLQKPIPVFLVARAPFPGAVTYRDRDGGGVCFVGIAGTRGTLLYESILHEATHALDFVSEHGVLNQMRERIDRAGVGKTERGFRDIPHTLIFIQAAETVRRVIDPGHRDDGEVAGYYATVPQVAAVERPLWAAHLDGKLSLDEALQQIVAGLTGTGDIPGERGRQRN